MHRNILQKRRINLLIHKTNETLNAYISSFYRLHKILLLLYKLLPQEAIIIFQNDSYYSTRYRQPVFYTIPDIVNYPSKKYFQISTHQKWIYITFCKNPHYDNYYREQNREIIPTRTQSVFLKIPIHKTI